jgi:hypothetical protein
MQSKLKTLGSQNTDSIPFKNTASRLKKKKCKKKHCEQNHNTRSNKGGGSAW